MAAQDKTESWLTYAGQVAHWGADYSLSPKSLRESPALSRASLIASPSGLKSKVCVSFVFLILNHLA